MAALEKLRRSAHDVSAMLDAIEGARTQLSSTSENLNFAVDEFRGQIMVIKERVAWLLTELDGLHALIGKTTNPGDIK